LEVFEDFTEIDSQTGILIDCSSAAPGWTPDEFAHYHVWLYAADQVTVLAKFTIGTNSADTITVVSPKSFDVPAGSFLRVGIPAFRLTYQDGSNFRSGGRGIPGTAPGRGTFQQFGRRPGGSAFVWHSVTFISKGDFPTFVWEDSHAFIGAYFYATEGSFGISNVFNANSYIWSGMWAQSGTAASTWWAGFVSNEEMAGYCLSMKTPAVAYDWGYVESYGDFVGPILCGGMTSDGRSWILDGYRFSSDGINYGQYGSIESRGYTQIFETARAGNGACFGWIGQPGGSGPNFYAHQQTLLEIFSPAAVTANGNGEFLFVRGGHVRLGAPLAPVFPTNLNPAVRAIYGGNVRLAGSDFAWLGDATISQINPLTRPAGAWAVNESVSDAAAAFTDLPKDGASTIYRTA